jgi:hypothetical protein
MKFRVNKGTRLYDSLVEISEEANRCQNEAAKLVKKLGYRRHRQKSMVLAGGISSIEIPGTPPPGWRKAYAGKVEGEYFPSRRKQNKELLDKIATLPVIEYSRLNGLIKFDPYNSKNNRVCFHPAIAQNKNFFLISIPSYMRYKPVKHMTEILESEYEKLLKKINK